MHILNMMSKLLILLHDPGVTRRKVSVICTIIRSLFKEHFNTTDIKRHVCYLLQAQFKLNHLLQLNFHDKLSDNFGKIATALRHQINKNKSPSPSLIS